MHNSACKHFWDVGILQSVFYEIPVEPIKSFLQIHFDRHPACGTLFAPHRMYNFLSYNDVVSETSPSYEARLKGKDKLGH